MNNPEKRPLTQSMINSYCWCARKYWYQYIYGVVLDIFHFPFVIGEAAHTGVQSLLKYKDLDKALEAAADIIQKRKTEYEKTHTLSADEDQNIIFQQVNVEAMIRNYYSYYKDFIKEVKVLFIERILKYDMNLAGNFILTSKLDAIIKLRSEIYVYELKTSKSPSYESVMGAYAQMMSYYINASQKYKIAGIYFNVIKKPQFKLGKNESTEDYLIRLEENYKLPDNFYDDIVIPQKRHIKQLTDLIKSKAIDIHYCEEDDYVTYANGDWWHYNRFMCRIYGNCEYLPLCDNGINDLTLRRYRRTTSMNEELED